MGREFRGEFGAVKHWVWAETEPEYAARLELMAQFIKTRFHEYRVSQLELI